MIQRMLIVRGHLMEFIYACAYFAGWTSDYGPVDGAIDYRTKISRDIYHRCCDKCCWKMAEKQGFKFLKCHNNKKKEIILLDVDLAGVEHQQIE